VLEFVKTIALSYAGIQTLIGAAQALATRGKAGLPAFSAALAAAGGAVLTDVLKQRTLSYFDDLESRLATLGSQAGKARTQFGHTADSLDRLSAKILAEQEAEGDGDGAGAGSGLNKVAERAKKLQERLEGAAKALREEMNTALEDATQRLEDAQQAFDDFAGSVSRVFSDAMDFGQAAEEAGTDLADDFFGKLEQQASKAENFGVLVEQLLAKGISKEALEQVLAAGVDSGAAIAKTILESADGVLRANKLVERTQEIADKIGQAAAGRFYAAGVANGQEYLRGVVEAIAEAERRIAGAKRPADIKGAAAAFSDTVGRLAAPSSTVQNVTINSQSLDPSRAGEVIVDALREYNQRSGYIGLAVQAF